MHRVFAGALHNRSTTSALPSEGEKGGEIGENRDIPLDPQAYTVPQ